MIEITPQLQHYLYFCVFCLVSYLIFEKVHRGYVTIGTFIAFTILALLPIVNVIMYIVGLITVCIESGFLSKKLF